MKVSSAVRAAIIIQLPVSLIACGTGLVGDPADSRQRGTVIGADASAGADAYNLPPPDASSPSADASQQAVPDAGAGSDGGITSPDLPCAVASVLHGTCQNCHGAVLANGAPIHLVTAQDLRAASTIDTTMRIGERCVLRMRTAPPAGMPPPPLMPIDMASIDAFDSWVVAGMPAASCNSGGTDAGQGADAGTTGTDAGTLPFTPDTTIVYLTKVKNVLVGLPPTDQELQTVTADPSQLGALVDGWMQLPEYQQKMMRFFELAFQQTQVISSDFTSMTFPAVIDSNAATAPLLLQNLQESFARTMLSFAMNGTPFNQAMSTRTFAMTTALKVYYAFEDAFQAPNAVGCGIGASFDSFKQANPGLQIYYTASAIPLSQSLDPTSANYMHWTDPDVTTDRCPTDPVIVGASGRSLYDFLFGDLRGATNGQCPGSTASSGPLQAADFQDWQMTTIQQPTGSQTRTPFYDLLTLRSANTLLLTVPRVGFLTPAFFANWPTNASNQMRVTMNQAFIVATGAQVDGNDLTAPSSTPGLDAMHAPTNSACYVCHRILDPSRSILSATYSWNYGHQPDQTIASQPGLFAFQGVIAPVSTIYDLGTQLEAHPLLPSGWAQRLCYYVNSEACLDTDPDFQALVQGFRSSSYSWNQLVKAVVTSPITTHVRATQTASSNGEVVAVARRDHLCAAWNARFGLADACGLNAAVSPVLSGSARSVVAGLPSDGYARGRVAPVLPTEPTLFFRGGIENLCEGLAALLIDNASAPSGARTWSSTNSTTAIADFVQTVMAVPPSDPRTAGLIQTLTAHFTAALGTTGISRTAALQSTFVAACQSPPATAIGM
jgi:hypothetical protein